jgi:hypothetical protein
MQMPRVLSAIKGWVVGSGSKPRLIRSGAFKGLKMDLDLSYQMQVVLGLAEREVFPHLRALARLAKTGIDIGAAEGEYTLFFLSLPHVRQVFAFDPSERFPAGLSANLALNGFADDRRAVLVKKYVGNQEGEDRCTLDSLAEDLEGPCVVKVDVDGGEGTVLQGAHKLLERGDVSWIIETHSEGLERECEQVLRSKGLTATVIKNAWWRVLLPERRPIPHNRWLAAWHDGFAADSKTRTPGLLAGVFGPARRPHARDLATAPR